MGRFDGKVVIVTGGGSGIGAATAHRFAAEGATTVIAGRTQDTLDKTVADAPSDATLVARVADTSDASAVAALVDGVFLASRAALPHLREAGGSIVNVGSVSGLGGDWSMAAYNAAKGAVTNLTNAMALDHGAEGVRVNAVHPSLTVTGMSAGIRDDEQTMTAFRERIAMRRPAEPDEVASVIAFLAGDDARFVTGAHIPVDGGLGASNGQPRLG